VKGRCVKGAFYAAAILCIAIHMPSPWSTASAQSQPAQGDGIFTPRISPVAGIDKTGRPITIEATQPEPSFAALMVAGKPTGDSYVINFPTGSTGGACLYSGTGRYLIESTGTLTFQILADCGKLRRAYSYMICPLNEDLRCSEAAWWHFKDRTFAVTSLGVLVNDCRNFHPSTKSYEIHELPTTCLVKSVCDGAPNVDSLRDGDVVDWNSAIGNYVKQKNKISDVSSWVCWIRTQ
jgi:hypothetical protein